MASPDKVNVLLIGGGGREHALAWKMAQSPRLGKLWLTDQTNPGLLALGTPVDVPVDIRQIFRLQRFCDKNDIGLVIIGPEEPLAQGYTDALIGPGRVVFGPTQQAAQLESDKAWAKQLMREASIPTAEGRIFNDPEPARAYVESRVHDEEALRALYEDASRFRDPVDRRKYIQQQVRASKELVAAYRKRHDDLPVIKASGLAKGKGVFLPTTLAEAIDIIDRIMVKKEFGDAGRTILIEERLEGREISVLALTDGRAIYVLEPCRDHKRLGDGDSGPNTGGMGVICPGPLSGEGPEQDEALLRQIESEILVPTLDALRRSGIDYRGVLYAGLMLTPAGPKVLEFNCRFGDPECQALMMRLDSDLIELMLAVGARRLEDADIRWKPGASCCVVLASPGYPDKPKAGIPIAGLDAAGGGSEDVVVFHSGTRRDEEGRVVTAGGRVLSVTSLASTLAEAQERAYRVARAIQFEGKQMRSDIGGAPGRAVEVAGRRRVSASAE